MPEFDWSIDNSWNEAGMLLASCLGRNADDLQGIWDLRHRWAQSKRELLDLIDPVTGRSVSEVDTPLSDIDVGAALREAFSDVWYDVHIIPLRSCLQVASPDEVISNKHSSGMRLGKYIAQQAENDQVRQLFLKHYDVLQRMVRSTGWLVISVNPLDILMMSMHGIRSCHRIDGGEYRAGTLCYLIDKHTAIAYFYSRESRFYHNGYEAYLPEKRWRQIVYMDPVNKSAIFSRQYPYESEAYYAASRRVVAYALGAGMNSVTWVKTESWQFNKHGSFAYIDPAIGSIYLKPDGSPADVRLSGVPLCLVCGDTPITSDGLLICDDCDDAVTCYSCGSITDEDNMFDNECYCDDCYNERFSTCSDCGDTYSREDLLDTPGGVEEYCLDCYHKYITTCDYCGDPTWRDDLEEAPNGRWYCKNCYDDKVSDCTACDEPTMCEYLDDYGRCSDCAAEAEEMEVM